MRTKAEVDEEVTRLMALKAADGPHRHRVELSIAEAVEELRVGVDSTCEEFDNQPDIVKDAVFEARSWKDGRASERPSEGYGQLVVN
jgi:hypothetical protein